MDRRMFRWIMIGIAVVSAVLLNLDNMYIASVLRDRQERLTVSVGTVMEPLSVENIDAVDGNLTDEVVEFSERTHKTLVFLLSPTCGLCADNLPMWVNLEAKIDRDKFRILVLATTGGKKIDDAPGAEFIREKIDIYRKALDAPVRVVKEREDLIRYRLTITPQTFIVSEKGYVEKVWVGQLSSRLTQREINNVLDLL